MFVKGYRSLEKEIHITYVLKQIRVMKGILKEAMTNAEWQNAIIKYGLKSVEKQTKNASSDKQSSLEISKSQVSNVVG